MSVLVDTPIWSVAYCRLARNRREQELVELFGNLVARQLVWLVGPVRQEILSGFNQPRQFAKIRAVLRAFEDVEIMTDDFELAAELHNHCRRKGVQGSNTDLLLCAIAIRRNASVLTTDADFTRFARFTGVRLFDRDAE